MVTIDMGRVLKLAAATEMPVATLRRWARGSYSAHGYWSYTYFVGEEGDDTRVKIGRAIDPVTRLSGLQIGNHRRMVLLAVCPGVWRTEKLLHRKFESDRITGEWFRRSESVNALIDLAASTGPIPTRKAPWQRPRHDGLRGFWREESAR